MRANKGKDTAPELQLRRMLREAGYPGYRLHWRKAAGHPDIAYPGRRIAIFVNGCFWHRCPSCAPPVPKANRDFWSTKFADTVRRDELAHESLSQEGWIVVVIWECELAKSGEAVLSKLVSALAGVPDR